MSEEEKRLRGLATWVRDEHGGREIRAAVAELDRREAEDATWQERALAAEAEVRRLTEQMEGR